MFKYELTYNATTIETADPQGWDGLELVLRRDLDYHGVFFEFSENELGFSKEAKAFIESALDADGIDADVSLSVGFDPEGFGNYQSLISGKLDLTAYQKDRVLIMANVEQAGLIQKFKNRIGFDVSFSNPRSVDDENLPPIGSRTLNLHSREIIFRTLLESAATAPESIDYSAKTFGARAFVLPALAASINEVETAIEHGYVIVDDTQNVSQIQIFNDNYFVFESQNGGSYTVRLKAKGNFTSTNGGAILRIVIGDAIFSGQFIISDPVITYPAAASTDQDFDSDTEYQVTLAAGQKIWVWWRCEWLSQNPRTTQWTYDELSLLIVENTTYPPTVCKAYPVHDALNKCLQRILGGEDLVISDVFGSPYTQVRQYPAEGDYWEYLITNGFNLRNFPDSEAKDVVTSFEKLYTGLDAIFNLGLSIEEPRIRIEKKGYFYQDAVSASFECVEFTESPSPLIYNESVGGYDRYEVDRVNGLESFAAMQSYALPIKSIRKRHDFTSRLVADMHAIEFTRREQYDENSTTPEEFDGDVFIIHGDRIAPAEYNSVAGENITNSEGLFSPSTVYNIAISVKRNLFRWRDFIYASLLKKTGETIKFMSGTGKTIMESLLIGESTQVVENGDITIVNPASLALIDDKQIEFEAPMSIGQYNAIKAAPYSAVEYSVEGEAPQKGNVLEIRYKPVPGRAIIKLIKRL